jgi:hypothetical protein
MDYDDAYFEYINGQNDAIDLMPPQSNNKCYLEGWHDAKRRLASGELCWIYEERQKENEPSTDDRWEEF